MIKSLLLILFCLILILFSCSISSEPEDTQDITGLWKSTDQHSDKPRALVAIYKYQDEYYGRILATYDDEGKIKDTILEKREKATEIVGNPPYCGMDFIYNVKEEEDNGEENVKYKGKIVDPEKGKVYDAELWLKGDDLIVRGELCLFGKKYAVAQSL